MSWFKRKNEPHFDFITPVALGAPLIEGRGSCSLCGKPLSEIRYLLAGAKAAICNECIDLCAEVALDNAPVCTFCGRGGVPIVRGKRTAICAACAAQAVYALPPPALPK